MAGKSWENVELTRENRETVRAVAPVIVSASRRTDIPALYGGWLLSRLRAGYCAWTNPFNRTRPSYVSFARTRAFVFWTKNPRPIFSVLDDLDKRAIGYYFQFTLNDYEREKIEPGVPPLDQRIGAFRELGQRLGVQRVVWRFDPLILSNSVGIDTLLARIANIGNQLVGSTNKLVFSFGDIDSYARVKRNLGEEWREFTSHEMLDFAQRLALLNRDWGFELATCAEEIDLAAHGVAHNRCIDPDLLKLLYPGDRELCAFLDGQNAGQQPLFEKLSHSPVLKDRGQRNACLCAPSKDIGSYNTCAHLCRYCYANASESSVRSTCASLSGGESLA